MSPSPTRPRLVPYVDTQSGPAFSRTGTDPTGEVGCLPDERVVVATGGHYALMRRAFSSDWQVTHANSGDVMLRDPLAKRRVDARLPSATAGLEVLDYLRLPPVRAGWWSTPPSTTAATW